MNNLVKRILGTIAVTAAVAFAGFVLPETPILPRADIPAYADNSGDWTAVGTAEALVEEVAKGGNIRLIADINTSSALEVPSGKTVTLDLNGYKIDRGLTSLTDVGNVITVNGNLTLTDSSTGGTITGGKTTFNGGGVYVEYGATFTMSGGKIIGCSAGQRGGGVYVFNGGEFTMNGGTISGCSANYSGGGVSVDNGGTFTMSGGTISGCSSDSHGGGVAVNGTFTMSGGTIKGCSSRSSDGGDGGVYVSSVTDGEGVHSGTFNVSGKPVISGNKKGDAANNVVFESSHPTKTINVIGELTTGASIYVNAGKGDVVAVGSGYTLTESDAKYFHSDYDGLASALDDGNIVFKAKLPDFNRNKDTKNSA